MSSTPKWAAFTLAELARRQQAGERPYFEFLRVPAMSAGVYRLPAGGLDRQRPHQQDEMYSVVSGKARFRAGDDREGIPVGPGAVLYVPAMVEHKFFAIEEELTVLVFFAPAEEEE